MCTTFLPGSETQARYFNWSKYNGTKSHRESMFMFNTSFVHIRAASSKLCTQLHGNIKENLPDDHSPTSSFTLDGVKCP